MLLDSTRPIGKDLNNDHGRPESSSVGDLYFWYALRATYSRELKVQSLLCEKGYRTFVPMMWRKLTIDGKLEKKLVPAVNNLVFVYATKTGLDSFIRSFGDSPMANYYWDRTANRPLVIPAKAMEDFIAVSSSMDEDLIYLTEISDKLREGQIVKVKDGPFKGIEGKIVRIRKSRRILVELPGMLAVASTYVSPEIVEF